MDQDIASASQNTTSQGIFYSVPFYIIALLTFLVPLWARFGSNVAAEPLKTAFIVIGVTLATAFFVFGLLAKRSIQFLKHPIIYAALAALLATLLSASIAEHTAKGFIGSGFDLGTFFGITSLFLVFFFTAMFARSKSRVTSLLLVLCAAVFISGIVLLVNAFAGYQWLGLDGLSQTLLGNWTDSAFIFGLLALVSGIAWELMPIGGIAKKIIIGTFVVATIGFLLTNYSLAWWIVGIAALAYTLYRIVYLKMGDRDEFRTYVKHPLITPTLALVLLAAVFLIFVRPGNALDRATNKVILHSIDARPTWATTIETAKNAWHDAPWFGVGLSRFSLELEKNKPDSINYSPFWGVDFNYGFGYLPTFLVTEGIIGSLSWALFILCILWCAFRSLLRAKNEMNGLLIAIAFATIVSWVVLFFFVPGATMLFIAFLFTGLFTGLLVGENSRFVVEKSTDTKTAFGFITMALLVVIALGSVSLEYVYAQKARALSYHSRAVLAMTQKNDFAGAVGLLEKATSVSTYDVYLRTLVDARIADLSLRLNQGKLSPAEVQTTFLNEYPGILKTAEEAVAYDQNDYLNWVSLATTYQMALSLGVSNAYDRALVDYNQALSLNPKSPGIYLGLARLELARNNFDNATKWLNQALTLKPNYIDALYLNSQIAVRTGNTDEAIKRAIAATSISPDNVGLLFQLGILYYQSGNFAESAQVLARAITLQNNFSNAYYYLGLAEYKLGKKDLSLAAFEKVLSLNPDNTLAKSLVANVNAGNDPLYGISLSGSTALPSLSQ